MVVEAATATTAMHDGDDNTPGADPAATTTQPSTDEIQLHRPLTSLTQFAIYESRTQLCLIGSNSAENLYRILRVDRNQDILSLMAAEDPQIYTKQSISAIVNQIQSTMKCVASNVCGIVGVVRFTKGLYLSLVTKRRPVALLGGHFVYHVEDTRLLSVAYRPERTDMEERLINTFKNVDLTKNFYYSHTYDITRTLQQNMRGRSSTYQSTVVWNYQLLINTAAGLGISSEWTVALVHGYIDQSRLSVLGRDVFVTLIARRSRVFAGVRYLKRGVNDSGFVANDVETEQIVATMEVTGFTNGAYTAYVQHRGSIPLFWSQETSGITPKPPIEINVRDPYFVEAGRHFSSLFQRYGAPVIVLNLIKTKERARRESVLGEEFSEGLRYLNQFLPLGCRIRYLAWDMSRAKKNRQEDVLAILEVIAEEALSLTGFFHSKPELYANYLKRQRPMPSKTDARRSAPMLQAGVVRSNCIDCLDRTNAAQSIIGKVALAHQLYALGIISHPHLSFATDAAAIIEEMYHDLGNTIALQYGGSHLVNTVQTYRRNTNWRSHSRDIVEALRRYYSNSLLDVERQEAITYFVERTTLPRLQATSKASSRPSQVDKPALRKWWATLHAQLPSTDDTGDAFWNEYYQPTVYTSLDTLFVGSLNSSASLHPLPMNSQNAPSPFADRSGARPPQRLVQQEPKWLKDDVDQYADPTVASRADIYARVCARTATPQILQPLAIGPWVTDGIDEPLQEPRVSRAEHDEYEKYVRQFDSLQKWIVPPSNVLYKDYIKTRKQQQTRPVYQKNRPDDWARSQTPVPQKMPTPWSPTPAAGRTRSNTTMLWGLLSQNTQASNNSNNNSSGITSSAVANAVATTSVHQSIWNRTSRRDRSRSLDLGKGNDARLSPFNTMVPSHRTHANNAQAELVPDPNADAAAAVVEPRVTEADLKIYQDFVKMRKAFNGQI
ncbi:phosphatidylinositol-3,5-bisphosphate 5-phosphatase [Coemansia sp. RSA 1722]|nr:phosphatidylinositol-3,5-bisphosphate 5-phosphatase [Coemansia sp. RSA 486]KAJ2235571.1 phosphatidylinositol-3,5-bisphosphate 5-phosphatase [Coemansia sp. RSA 485]KAJ2602838.1 phosphatidylinositol-3,5-bisphosphate 5-phosphatase [Coemansia sp. RSA 1721]KAJ2606700.1 phosphatidylinositol-3,5-bisphosphate 5-phosphatase [Coemansia sp. RSA 1722]KAJ2639823.1 phosphatidylinositol-3,5-bisphosphate 5-phosphatase [Coemansia sp. RSA 1286]